MCERREVPRTKTMSVKYVEPSTSCFEKIRPATNNLDDIQVSYDGASRGVPAREAEGSSGLHQRFLDLWETHITPTYKLQLLLARIAVLLA